jgi:hypothetical protein
MDKMFCKLFRKNKVTLFDLIVAVFKIFIGCGICFVIGSLAAPIINYHASSTILYLVFRILVGLLFISMFAATVLALILFIDSSEKIKIASCPNNKK